MGLVPIEMIKYEYNKDISFKLFTKEIFAFKNTIKSTGSIK